jgi:acetylornithine/succinyldiaminopimelate/putrescine aminotransferase
MERGLLVLTAGDTVVRFVPPLIVTEGDVDRAVGIVDLALAGLRA